MGGWQRGPTQTVHPETGYVCITYCAYDGAGSIGMLPTWIHTSCHIGLMALQIRDAWMIVSVWETPESTPLTPQFPCCLQPPNPHPMFKEPQAQKCQLVRKLRHSGFLDPLGMVSAAPLIVEC